jgi:uncharacterized membrane protein YccC
MVMRPDFHQTYARAVGRLAGTLAGVALATGMVQALGPDAPVFGALAVVSAALSYTLLRTGYAYSQCFTAAYVVFLLGMGGQAWEQTVPERVVLTLLGGALAMLAYVVFPAWETPRLLGRLADWLAADGRYAAAVLRSYAEPTREHRADMRRALLASREARAAWQAAYDQARQEPVGPRGLTSREAEEAQEALQGLDRAAMLMESHVPRAGSRFAPEAERFAEALEADTARAAVDVREHRNPDWGRGGGAPRVGGRRRGPEPGASARGRAAEAGPGGPRGSSGPHTPGTGRQLSSRGATGAGGRGWGR